MQKFFKTQMQEIREAMLLQQKTLGNIIKDLHGILKASEYHSMYRDSYMAKNVEATLKELNIDGQVG